MLDVAQFGLNMGQAGPVQTQFLPGGPQRVFGVQTSQPGPLFGDLGGLAGLQQKTGPTPPMGSGASNPSLPCSSEAINNYNPFL